MKNECMTFSEWLTDEEIDEYAAEGVEFTLDNSWLVEASQKVGGSADGYAKCYAYESLPGS